MSKIIDFATRQKQKMQETDRTTPVAVIFYSPTFHREDEPQCACVRVEVDDGDVIGLLDIVRDHGGIWLEETSGFIPWPCAYVEIECGSSLE